ncbi:MAG: metallopeptidase family protein [Bacteroidetes bacterium]|nr:metallopeptidase family protein [Bacteroidota bacterium]MCL5027262.1 metallopeptidase family protein [Chloroflexota bacterium]
MARKGRPSRRLREPQEKPSARPRRRQSLAQRRFEVMVQRAVDGLPKEFHDLLAETPVVVEDEPTAEDLAGTGTPEDETLFGMYQGVPLTERSSSYGLSLPERIVIYRLPLEEECDTRQETIWEIQRTLVHELAHHFGISEERIAELGWE